MVVKLCIAVVNCVCTCVIRTILIALTTDGYDSTVGIQIEQYDDHGYVFLCRACNGWMTQETYFELVRFVVRLSTTRTNKMFIDDVCTGHKSTLVKGVLFNSFYKYESIPGGGTGLSDCIFIHMVDVCG